MRKADFENILTVLAKDKPKRPSLFEFFLNGRLHKRFGASAGDDSDLIVAKAFESLGYDYVTMRGSFIFPIGEQHRASSVSLNEGSLIHDRDSFRNYPWPEPRDEDYTVFERVGAKLGEGMKIIAYGPGGVLENVTQLCGYDNLCFMLADDPQLVQDVFDAVGSRLVKHYRMLSPFKSVGAMVSNDDWGFKTQTMLSPDDMRKYVFPWHKKIVEAIHESQRPAILHSCGRLDELMDEIIDDLKYDAKHSYEDAITPVESAYGRWGRRIAILGGIDVDFLCRSSEDEIRSRCEKMLDASSRYGAYALGSGNSIPDYVPDEKYLAMISVVTNTIA